MTDYTSIIRNLDWQRVSDDLNTSGFSVLPGFLPPSDCQNMIDHFDHDSGFRKTVIMERHRFGLGRYKYWDYPLPDRVQTLRTELYAKLVPIANLWMSLLRLEVRFPDNHAMLQDLCFHAGQTKPTPLILRYEEGGYNTLHQDLYGDVYFPLQAAVFLNQPEEDYTGGEFVLTQQVPRSQSKVMVLTPKRGDMVIFATNFRPIKGARGYYRAQMRHGVSEIRQGRRHTLGIIFHDAVS